MIEQIQHIFIQETTQQLSAIQASLDSNGDVLIDEGMIEKIFLVMHSIKGSGPMFGFPQMPQATLYVEHAYAKIRKGELLLSAELIENTNHIVRILIDALNKKSDEHILLEREDLITYFKGLCS